MRVYWSLPFKFLLDIIGWIGHDWPWDLNKFEKDAVSFAARYMSEDDRIILREQLKHSFFVQREHKNRMNDIFPYFPDLWPQMQHPKSFCIATLKVSSKIGRMRVTVESYDGMIRAVRCSKPPKPIIAVPYKIELVSAGTVPTDEVAREINAIEHGDLE